MRSASAIALVLLGAWSSGTYANEPYRCQCCSAHFGKNPDAPSYWGKGLGNARLARDSKYEEIVARFDDAFRKQDYTLADVFWAGEALYALGALRSGLRDPHKRMMYVQEEQPQDTVAHDVWWMQQKHGKRIWDKPTIEQYGYAAICAISEIRKESPQAPRPLVRYLTLLTVTGQFDQVLREVSALREDSLAIGQPLGEYLTALMPQYIGSALYEEGAAYLATVKKAHGLTKETLAHWTQRLLRAVQDQPLAADQKKRLLAKIRGI
jgi:hypothetical protein